jgi:hypothetical protein
MVGTGNRDHNTRGKKRRMVKAIKINTKKREISICCFFAAAHHYFLLSPFLLFTK